MKTKQVIAWAIVIAGLFGLLWLAGRSKISSSRNESTKTENQLTNSLNQPAESETFYDFGAISMKNGNVSKLFKVINKTDKDIFYPNLTTSCMCTKAYFIQSDGNKKGPFGMPGMGFVPKLNETIKMGEMANIEVVYDPNAHGPAGVGVIDRFVYLTDADGNKLQLEIKANVTP